MGKYHWQLYSKLNFLYRIYKDLFSGESQQLKEDPDSAPSTHTVAHNSLY